MSKLNKYIMDSRVRSSFYTPNRMTFKPGKINYKFKKRQQGGEDMGVIAENNEWVKLQDGTIARINDAPTHDDAKVFTDKGFRKTSPRKGGIQLNGVESVISATHENRNSKDKSYTDKDEEIKIKPQEAVDLVKEIGFKIAKPDRRISPSKLLDLTIEAKNKFLSKFKPTGNAFSMEAQNSIKANQAIINSLPTDEDLYDHVFSLQEGMKSDTEAVTMQQGGSVLKSDDRGDFQRWLDRKTIGFRNYDHNMTNTAKQVWGAYDKQFPTPLDKVNSISAVAGYAPNPFVSIPANAINMGIDAYQGNGMELSGDMFSTFAKFSPYKRARVAGKFVQGLFGTEDATNTTILKQEGGFMPVSNKLTKYLKK